MKLRKLADRAGAHFINGLNAGNHEPSRQANETEVLGKMTMATGLAISLGSAVLETVGVGPEDVMNMSVVAGLGGAAIGAGIYAMGRING